MYGTKLKRLVFDVVDLLLYMFVLFRSDSNINHFQTVKNLLFLILIGSNKYRLIGFSGPCWKHTSATCSHLNLYKPGEIRLFVDETKATRLQAKFAVGVDLCRANRRFEVLTESNCCKFTLNFKLRKQALEPDANLIV